MDFEQDIKNCLHTLREGGVILYPTDTIWGLGCDAFHSAAIDNIFAIKNRPREKSLIILLADARDILHYTATPPPDITAILEAFDRPVTVVYRHPLGFPENAIHENGTIAIRVTTDPFCKALIKRFRKPLISTSANLSGQPSPATFRDIDPVIISRADYTVRYRQDDRQPAMPSRLVTISDEGELKVIRE